MKRLLIVLILGGIGYWGYTTYFHRQPATDYVSLSSSDLEAATDTQATSMSTIDNVASVLGTSISRTIESGKNILSDATNGKSDPIINKALENIQNEVKDLPKETVDKVKYEFCKDVISEYENKSAPN